MTAATTTDQVDLDQLEADAQARIAELDEQESRLALDALNDGALAQELRDVQSERAAAEGQLRQASKAREEVARREAQAAAEATEEARQKADREARRLQGPREQAAADWDAACAVLAEAGTRHARILIEQQQQLVKAGRKQLYPADSAYTAAMVCAMLAEDTPRGVLEFAGINPKAVALTESDPKPVEPLPAKSERSAARG